MRLRAGDPAAPTLALVAAVALWEAVAGVLGTASEGALQLKWPNDLLLDGAKLSGILLERSGDAVVIGFGVNLAHHPALAERATTSLAEHGAEVAPARLHMTLAEAFARRLSEWRRSGIAAIRDAWLAAAHPVGAPLTARLPDGGTLEGRFDGLDQGGALNLRLASGERRVIHAADVFTV